MTSTTPIILTGDSLIAFVNDYKVKLDRQEATRTDMIKDAGYVYDNGSVRYTDFYTELLRAKGIPVNTVDIDVEAYDALDKDEQELYDKVENVFGEKWDHEDIMGFIEQLKELDIIEASQIEEYFEFVSDNQWDAEKEFAKYYVLEACGEVIPEIVEDCINWQYVYDSNLSGSFDTIDYDRSTYFFRNN